MNAPIADSPISFRRTLASDLGIVPERTLVLAEADHDLPLDALGLSEGRSLVVRSSNCSLSLDRHGLAERLLRGELVHDVIVWTHTGSATLHAIAREESAPEGAFADTLRFVQERYDWAQLDEQARVELLAQEHALLQLERVWGLPQVQLRRKAGQLQLHAWVSDGPEQLWAYDFQTEQFSELSTAAERWQLAQSA